ncbi:hypothetical protein BDZ89DRAFT_1112245 [Hymenopellis radicata]|nr:hypothetical protein BDZ89DRAFT_1112245 [Hymenopellis radicata]
MSHSHSPSTSDASPLSHSSSSSPCAPSVRTTRTALAKKAADATTTWKNATRNFYESELFQAQVETTQGPSVVCYETTAMTRSSPISRDSDFSPIIKLIEIVARLLITSSTVRSRFMIPLNVLYVNSTEAQAQFRVLHPDKSAPEDDQLLEFVKKNFPHVIFEETAMENSLGKGDEEGADKNEMFISKDLVQAYLDTQANRQLYTVTEVQYAKVKRFVEFVLIASILRELGHCLTKYLFGPRFLTPYLPLLVGSDQRGDEHPGEIGQDIEMGILGCITVLEWADPALFYSTDASERLWRVDRLLGWVKKDAYITQWYSLTDAQIEHVIEMVHHGFICQIPFNDQKEIGGPSGKAIRAKFAARDGMNMIVLQEVIEDSKTGSEYLPRLGLQITLDPLAVRSATSGDRKF